MSTTITVSLFGRIHELKFTTENTLEKKSQKKNSWLPLKNCVQTLEHCQRKAASLKLIKCDFSSL